MKNVDGIPLVGFFASSSSFFFFLSSANFDVSFFFLFLLTAYSPKPGNPLSSPRSIAALSTGLNSLTVKVGASEEPKGLAANGFESALSPAAASVADALAVVESLMG